MVPDHQTENLNNHWMTPLRFVKGVGPKLAQRFEQKKMKVIYDLLHYYPRVYRDYREVKDISQLTEGQFAVITGEVFDKKILPRRLRRGIYTLTLRVKDNQFCLIKYFKLPFRGFFDSIEMGQMLKIAGAAHFYGSILEFHHPDILTEDEKWTLVPLYSEIEGVNQKKIRKIIHTIFETHHLEDRSEDFIPSWLREKYGLMGHLESLKDIHQPQIKSTENKEDLYLKFKAPSQKTLIFEEFFTLHLHLALKKLGLKKQSSYSIKNKGGWAESFEKNLPFELTSAQKRVFLEIKNDLKKNHPMNRLIQGDVGSGKTASAFQSAVFVMEEGLQSAIMAPTEILAKQHFESAQKFFKGLSIRSELLISKTKNKKALLKEIKEGRIDFIIGTHALIQEGVEFSKLGLVIIDEQHRFGVHQRQKLIQGKSPEKRKVPHLIVMTATPIPRTLAMSAFGELDCSIIDEKPKGRPPIITKKTSKRREVFSFLQKEITKGAQAYVVYPLVEESEKMDLKNALEQFEKLKKAFPKIKWGLIHGRMSFAEKSKTMADFKKGKTQVLVSTTVIEVGVDVPQATMMIIEHAERFGLSQLHQLRGRIGRGVKPPVAAPRAPGFQDPPENPHEDLNSLPLAPLSKGVANNVGGLKNYCILIHGKISDEARLRLEIMEKSMDGFELAEEDLKIRGAGEFLGVKQSGFAHFKMASLIRDQNIQSQARRAAQSFIDEDPHFEKGLHQKLKEHIHQVSNLRLS